MLRSLLTEAGELPDNATIAQALQPHMKSLGKQAKRAMPFVQLVREGFLVRGKSVLDATSEIDEQAVLEANYEYLIATLCLDNDGLEVTLRQQMKQCAFLWELFYLPSLLFIDSGCS